MSNAVKAWSYSAWAMYDRCPLQYKLAKIDKIGKPTSKAMERGNDIHVGVAGYLQRKVPAPPADAIKFQCMATLIEELREIPVQNIQVEQQWGYTEGFKPTGWFGKDTWFRSVLDVGVMYEDLAYEDVDWKTGKKYGSNMDQMETQAISVFCKFTPVHHVTTRLAYLDIGEFEFAEFKRQELQSLIDKWRKKVAPMFTDRVFAPRPNDKCHFCDFSRSKGGQCAFG